MSHACEPIGANRSFRISSLASFNQSSADLRSLSCSVPAWALRASGNHPASASASGCQRSSRARRAASACATSLATASARGGVSVSRWLASASVPASDFPCVHDCQRVCTASASETPTPARLFSQDGGGCRNWTAAARALSSCARASLNALASDLSRANVLLAEACHAAFNIPGVAQTGQSPSPKFSWKCTARRSRSTTSPARAAADWPNCPSAAPARRSSSEI